MLPVIVDGCEISISIPLAINSVNDSIFSATETIIRATSAIICVLQRAISLPHTIIDGTPAIISGSPIIVSEVETIISVTETVMCGEHQVLANQRVPDGSQEIIISVLETIVGKAETIISVLQTMISRAKAIISKRILVIDGPYTVIDGPHAIISGPDSIIYGRGAIISVVETIVSTTETGLSKADTIISAFPTSFLAAEIIISTAEKTADAVPAVLSLLSERINNLDAGLSEIIAVPSDHDQVVNKSRGCDKAIFNGHGLSRCAKLCQQLRPSQAIFSFPRQAMETLDPCGKPLFKFFSAPSSWQKQDTKTKLAQNDGIDHNFSFVLSKPPDDLCIRSRFRRLAQNIGIGQVSHSESVESDSMATKNPFSGHDRSQSTAPSLDCSLRRTSRYSPRSIRSISNS